MVAENVLNKSLLMGLAALCVGLIGGCSATHPAADTQAALCTHRQAESCSRRPLTVPGTDMTIGANWGRMTAMAKSTRRSWPAMEVMYYSGAVKHNPIYMRDLDSHSHFHHGNVTATREAVGLANIPWFYANLIMTPVLMCVNPPWVQVVSVPRHISPIYQGYLPLHGALAPMPVPGLIDWPYPVVHISGESSPTQ